MHLLIRFIVNAIVLYLIAKYVPGFNHQAGIWTAVIAAIIFGLINMLLGPILRLLSAPLTWLTHGLFSFVVNYILFALTTWLAPSFRAPDTNTWLANLYGTIIMTIVGTLLTQMWQPEAERTAT